MTFRTRDGNTTTLEPVEFLRRFVSHVLPSRFVKIRHYGLLATGKARELWKAAFKLLESGPTASVTEARRSDPTAAADATADWQSSLLELTGVDVRRCPRCKEMTMVREPLPESRAPPTAEAA